MKLSHPVTETDDHNTLRITQHKRYDRVIIPDHTARGHLRYLCHLHLRKLKPEEHLPEENLRLKNTEILVIIENMEEEDLLNFITVFTNQEQDPQVITSMANLLYLLSGDCAMLSVLPSISWAHVNACLQDVRGGNINHKKLLHLKEYTCETAHLISMTHKHDCVTLVTSFITWVIDSLFTNIITSSQHLSQLRAPIILLEKQLITSQKVANSSENCLSMIVIQAATSTPIMMKQILWTGSVIKISH